MSEGPISYVFLIVFAVLIFAAIGGQVLGIFSIAATLGNLSGFSLFIFENFGVWIFCGVVLSIILYFWRTKK